MSLGETMDELEDLVTYNGDPVHDIYVDYAYHINTGELDDEFGDSELVDSST